jgi:hypothetical protein
MAWKAKKEMRKALAKPVAVPIKAVPIKARHIHI